MTRRIVPKPSRLVKHPYPTCIPHTIFANLQVLKLPHKMLQTSNLHSKQLTEAHYTTGTWKNKAFCTVYYVRSKGHFSKVAGVKRKLVVKIWG